jgi:hypothetical protein
MNKYHGIAATAALLTLASYSIEVGTNLAGDQDRKDFIDFVSKHSKSYATNDEFEFRF